MQIYSASQKGPLKISGFIDPDDTTNISVFWGAPQWSANTVYRSGDVARPATDNGYYYKCTVNGVSGIQEPQWTQDTLTDNTVEFTAVPWDLWLLPDQSIINSVWTASEGINLGNNIVTAISTSAVIMPYSNTIQEFQITNQVTKSNMEVLSRTFLYKSNQQ